MTLPKPVLLDDLVKNCNEHPVQVGTMWGFFIARPLLTRSLLKRITHAWLVLTGHASAFQYAEDRIDYFGSV